jgi:hypothetical protein
VTRPLTKMNRRVLAKVVAPLAAALIITGTGGCETPAGPHPQHSATATRHAAPTSPSPTATWTPSAPPNTSPSPDRDGLGLTATASPAETASPADAALAVADGFAHAWVYGSLPAAQWWAGVAPFCDAHLAGQLRTTDPGRVPATRVIDPPFARTATAVSVAYDFSTDSGVLVVTVKLLAVGWRVTNVDFWFEDDQ